METFYDGDLKDIWDSDLDPTDTLKMSTDTDMHDWFLERDVKDPTVILNDKLISDALLNGTLPIKSEHSYSLNSDGDSLPDSPRSLHTKIDDMDDECYPAISLKTATSNLRHTDTANATIDPKCLTISPTNSISCSPVVVTTILSNGGNGSRLLHNSHTSQIVLARHNGVYEDANSAAALSFNLRSLENTNSNSSSNCSGLLLPTTITKMDHEQSNYHLPQQLPSTAATTICGSPTSSRDGSSSPDICSDIEIDESCIKDEPISPDSSCPPSPNSPVITSRSLSLSMANMAAFTNSDLVFEHKNGCLQLTSASQSLLKSQSHLLLGSSPSSANIIPKLNIKTEPANGSAAFLTANTARNGNTYGLPLTPPSSLQSDDSEGGLVPASATAANVRRSTSSSSSSTSSSMNGHSSGRNGTGSSTRQPIHTPLISTQPKGSTGTLILTEEEKRTLLAEGYPIPQKLPLTKAEEKSLKKIRRKIKNKISAQESRRKKKEYMDQLERRVEVLVTENNDYRKRVESLEGTNANLLSQLHKLQALVQKQNTKKT